MGSEMCIRDSVGTYENVAEVVTYMEELRGEVLTGLEAGKSVETLQEEVTLDAYSDWLGYENWRTENIAGAVRSLQESGAVN